VWFRSPGGGPPSRKHPAGPSTCSPPFPECLGPGIITGATLAWRWPERSTAPGSRPDDEPDEPDELALIAAGFPGYRIWRSITYDRIRYVAQGVHITARPHTVVTASLAELPAELAAALQATAS
jgi:hypothetical protein